VATATSSGGERAGNQGWTPQRSVAGNRNPWAIVGVISIATFMTVLDTSIVNVALDHIAGSLAVSYDEASWVSTTFLIASAIVIPISGWLANVIGRKRYYMGSVALFTFASFCCGVAPNLDLLILARIVQGAAGGGLAAVEQSMLVDTFAPQRRGMAFAAYGMVVIAGPIIGPVVGGWITDNASWQWCFLINVPVGALSLFLVNTFVEEPPALKREREALLANGLKVDIIGFILVGLFFGCLEVTLDRGQEDDWFASSLIVATSLVTVISLMVFIPWELTRKAPIVPIRMFGNRNFGLASIFLLLTGVIIFGTTLFIPQLLQQVMGYTATDAGLALTAGGLATIVAMPISGFLTGRVDARYLIGGSFLVQALALMNMSHFSTDMAFANAAEARVFQAVGIPFLFVPLTNLAYVGLRPEDSNQASAMMNMARNLGGTMGISLVETMLSRRQQFHQSRMTETLDPLNPNYTAGLGRITRALVEHGQSVAAAPSEALATLYRSVQRQSAMLSYVDVFEILAMVIFASLLLVFLMRGQSTPADPGTPK
jgi:DHA2 family multidrug resistance protein